MIERRLVLASSSPYRRRLLERLSLSFDWVAPEAEELALPRESPRGMARRLASEKAAVVAARYPGAVVIGGDQVVSHDGIILGKPGSPERAIDQLQRLSGQVHELITGVVVIDDSLLWEHVDVTRLTMRRLGDEEIVRYVELDRPWDCAGSYKIEMLGIALFTEVETADPTAIEGMPLLALSRRLREIGFRVP